MSNRRGLMGACAALALVASGSAALAETLQDAIALAYGTNPTLQAQRAQQRALDETYAQSRAGFRPRVDLSGGVDYSRSYGGPDRVTTPPTTVPIDTNGDGIADSTGVIAGSTQTVDRTNDSGSVSLGVSQPLYTGGRVSYGVIAAEAEVMRGRENLRAIEAQVLTNVVQSYVDVIRDTETLRIRQDNVSVLQRQLDESSARFEVGEITRTDVAQSEARLAQSQALLSQAEAQLSVSRASYAAVVGQAPADLAAPPVLPGAPADFDAAMDVAQVSNPSLRAAQRQQDAAEARVSAARAEYRPSASLRASYGASDALDGFDLTDRQSLNAGASISIPLFTGGLNSSRVAQALEQANAAQIGVEGARRNVLVAVSQAYSSLVSSRSSLTASEEQVRASRIAAEGVRQEAQVGLRTTLDVLNAEQELRTAELSLVQARRNEYLASAQLLAAMGRLEAPMLVQGVDAYDPADNFDRVRNRGFTPWEPIIAAVDKIGAPTPAHANDQQDAPVDTQLKAQAARASEAISTAPR